ncbi:MAG: nucleotidyltransferase family protein [Nitrososphaerales archaeon]
MEALILAGGLGKRLKPLTDNIPKPMIRVAGHPIIEHQISWLRRQGVTKIIVCAGYRSNVIVDYLGDGRDLGVSIKYSIETNPLGTGGALKRAKKLVNGEEFLFMYGDILTSLNPRGLISALKERRKRNIVAAMAVVPLRVPFGIVEIKRDLASSFKEKPILKQYWMNAGVFCFSSNIFDMLPGQGSLESVTLVGLASKKSIRTVKYPDSLWRSIDSHKDIDEAEKEFADIHLG